MDHREIALEFLKRFCGGDIEATARLMAAGLQFSGPGRMGGESHVAPESLPMGPTRVSRYRVVNVIEDDRGDVTVLYEYERPRDSLIIAQWFGFNDRQIVETQLVFETKTARSDWSVLLRQGVRCAVGAPRVGSRPAAASA